MKEKIIQRLTDLISEGQTLINKISLFQSKMNYWVEDNELQLYRKWISSILNIVNIIDKKDGIFTNQVKRIMDDKEFEDGIPVRVILNLHGVLASLLDEMKAGLLNRVEDIIISETFDKFLDYAIEFHKGGKKKESSILASVVLEDSINNIALKNNIDVKGVSLDPLVDELVKKEVFTTVKGKRIKSFICIRNHAFHAEYDQYELRDVGKMIEFIGELLVDYPEL